MAAEISVAQMIKLHLSYMTVSVAVAAGADDTFFYLALNVAKEFAASFLNL